jgi:chorismate synthase
MSSFGNNIKFTVFGESHGPFIGVVIENLPAGLMLDFEAIKKDMARRAPTKNDWSTKRSEPDEVEIISGVFEDKLTGAPLCAMIKNKDTRSKDYSSLKVKPRPGHADYTAYVKYDGHQDYRGGGHFSARLTAPIVFAGSVARQILKKQGIEIGAHIANIGGQVDRCFDATAPDFSDLSEKLFAVIDDEKGMQMQKLILNASKEKDSIGGAVECAITGVKAGVGGPMFGGLEGKISSAIFAIPAVKAIAFGAGKGYEVMHGSKANDAFCFEKEKIVTKTNHCGGILGGISNGMPIIFNVSFKPTPSIAQPQNTVDLNNGLDTQIEIKGRHDACIIPRAVVVVEAMSALVILDEIMNFERI